MTAIFSNGAATNEAPPSYMRMFLLGLIVVSPSFLNGLNMSYTTIALPQMNLSLQDASWFGSIMLLSSPISAILVGLLIDKCGRKTALLFSLIPSIFGWLLLYWNYNVICTLLGQALNGLSNGASGFTSQVYISECVMMSHINLRNSYVTWPGISISLASLTMFAMGTFLDYHVIDAVSFALSVFLFLLFFFVIPESPSWLYHRGRIGDAEWSQKKLGIVQPVLTKHYSGELKPMMDNEATGWQLLKENAKKMTREDVYKPLLVLSVLCVMTQSGGALTVMTYMIDIINNMPTGADTDISMKPTFTSGFDRIGGSDSMFENRYPNSAAQPYLEETTPSDAYNVTLFSGVLMLLATILSSVTLPHFGIRKMIIIAQLCSALGMLALTYATIVDLFILRISSVWLIAFMFSLVVSAPSTMAADAFPRDAKGFASIPHVIASFCSSAIIKTYPYLRLTFGEYVYCFYVVGGVLASLYTYIFLPEIAGKTVEQVNEGYLSTQNKS